MIEKTDLIYKLLLFSSDKYKILTLLDYKPVILEGNVLKIFDVEHLFPNTQVELTIPDKIFDHYNNGEYSMMFSKSYLDEWKTYLKKEKCYNQRDKTIYEILTHDESMQDLLERKLTLVRGTLDKRELYDVYYIYKQYC